MYHNVPFLPCKMAKILKVGWWLTHTPLSAVPPYRCVNKRYTFVCQDSSNQYKRTDLQTEFGTSVILLKRKSHSSISIVIRGIPHLSVHPLPAFSRLLRGNFKPLNIFSLSILQYIRQYSQWAGMVLAGGSWEAAAPKISVSPPSAPGFLCTVGTLMK